MPPFHLRVISFPVGHLKSALLIFTRAPYTVSNMNDVSLKCFFFLTTFKYPKTRKEIATAHSSPDKGNFK